MPPEPHDERVGERIEAFLEGPPRARRTRSRHLRNEALRRARPQVPLDTRADWNIALKAEEARMVRYGRPTTILVIEVRVGPEVGLDPTVRRAGATLRRFARETDRVARVAPTRFHVLLPESTEADAASLIDRLQSSALAPGGEMDGSIEIRSAAVSPGHGQTLGEALRIAEARLDA